MYACLKILGDSNYYNQTAQSICTNKLRFRTGCTWLIQSARNVHSFTVNGDEQNSSFWLPYTDLKAFGPDI